MGAACNIPDRRAEGTDGGDAEHDAGTKRAEHEGTGRPGARMSPRTAGLTALAMVAFASNSLLCRAALAAHQADASSFTTLRVAAGAVMLTALARRRAKSAYGDGGWVPAVALFAYALGFSLAYLRIPAGTGALLLFAAVQVTMVGRGLLSGERPGLREWLGLGLSIAGLVALTRPGLGRPDPLGAGLMLVAGVAWGLYSLRGRRAVDPLRSNALSFTRAATLALGVSAIAVALGSTRLTAAGALLAVASGAIASGLGYATWYAALRGLTATQAAIVQLSVPPLAAVGGVLLLGEALSARLLLASAAILGGIALAVASRE
jgi:drug/metabolite transporter (DMT)-like permease